MLEYAGDVSSALRHSKKWLGTVAAYAVLPVDELGALLGWQWHALRSSWPSTRLGPICRRRAEV